MMAPTLIVGLGGKGSEIVHKVQKMCTDEQKKNIGFVAFDTDANELKNLIENNFDGKAIQTSTKMTVGEYLNIHTHARDEWFPVNRILNRKTLTEGASQVRAISRLAFDTTLSMGRMEPLHEEIDSLYRLSGDSKDQALRVIIVSSLGGGTGSGLILPVAMYIKNYMIMRYQQNASIMRGFFVLPEVFFSVIKSQQEQNNIKANAYATLRELDAFLMKGDGTLPEKYSNLSFKVPRLGSEEVESFDVMPYDFCFLFDAQNIHGRKLSSFNDYLEHAVNCIYAQSISPMNSRSNSSEDNIIRELSKSGGRNRYCGAGSSILKYPFEDIRDYLALHWAEENISTDWLRYDNQIKTEKEIQSDKRKHGFNVSEIDVRQIYVDAVEAGHQDNQAFSKIIRNQAYKFDKNGIQITERKWESYVEALQDYVQRFATSNQTDLAKYEDSCGEDAIRYNFMEENINPSTLQKIHSELVNFQSLALKRAEEVAKSISYSLVHFQGDPLKDENAHRLEYHLRDETGHALQPNAVRYFMYKLDMELEEQIAIMEENIREAKNNMKAYLEAPFNDFKTGAQIAAPVFIDQYIKQRGKLAKMFSKQKDAEARLKEEFTSFYTNVQNYRTDFVLLEVFKAMKSYAEKINNSYQSFFASLEVSIKRIKTNIDTIYNKYDYQEGSAVRYVCAGKPSLDALKKQIVSTNSIYQLPGELCNDLYNSIRAFAFSDSDVKNDGYFVDMFDDTIMAFWKTRVMDDYGTLINVDIITALENEAEFEHGIIQKDAKEKYIMEIMEQSERLSAPFIESPLGEQPRIISACTYNPSIVTNGYAERSNIINQKLIGGVEDEAIEQNMIIFYRAIYGLRANDLSKFAPPLKEETLERGGGEYYRAYFDLIEKISPETHKSDYITPHIDKRWHLISELPDLDEENQLTQERMILKSVFLGLLFKKISYTPSSSKSNEFLYSLDIDKRVALVVSNGTPCDLLYEVFDALTIHPISVKEILKACELDLQKELIAKVEIDSSKLIKALTNFRLPEFTRERASMLELPLFYKRSAPALEYSQDTALTLLDVIFETIREYVTSYAEAADVDLEFVKVLEEQMELFDANISKLEKEIPGIRKEILVVDIYKETAKQFANLNREDLEEKYKSAVDL